MFFNPLFLSVGLPLSLGLLFGSFFSVISYRLIRNMTWVTGRSVCPRCKKQIAWYDNLPLISFIFLKGRCRNCKIRISIRYPLIEIATGLGFVYLAQLFYLNPLTLIYSIIVFSILFIIFIIDFEHKIIPDSLIFVGLFVTVSYYLLTNNQELIPSLFAGLTSSLGLLIIHLLTRGRGMGLGDVKFAVWGGMLVGFRYNLIWLFLAFLTGGISGIILILGKRAGLKDQIAFGPFLIVAIGLTFVFGDKLIYFLGY